MKPIAVFILLSVSLLSGCASGQDHVLLLERQVADAETRLAQIESHLKQDTVSSQESEQGLRERFARMRVELDNVITELQKITGRLDEIEFKLHGESSAGGGQGTLIDDAVQSNSERIARLEKYLKLEPSPVRPPENREVLPEKMVPGQTVPPQEGPPREVGPAPIQPAPDLSEEQLYASARQAFDRNDFEGAREKFEKLITMYPKSQLAGNSQFWLGEVYFRENWFEKAILEYQKVIESYPKSNKVQSALLKQGLAFLMLKDKENARLILNELIKKYPKSPEADIARARLKQL